MFSTCEGDLCANTSKLAYGSERLFLASQRKKIKAFRHTSKKPDSVGAMIIDVRFKGPAMNKIFLRSLFLALLFCLNIMPLGFQSIPSQFFVQASPLLAQASGQPATPQNSLAVPKKNTPVLTPSPAPLAQPNQPNNPKPQTKEEPAPKTGPYDMKAMKAFNRALYGS
jgi:predicted component of type VI protein secretion system